MISFKEYPITWITAMMSNSKGPTLPKIAPKAISIEATQYEAAMNDF